MALVLRDRVKETTSTAGTGTYSLAGAVVGFETFASVGNGNTTYYGCSDGVDFEVGIGTYTASGTTLARTTILQSSNSDSAVNWGSGTRTIFCTLPAEKMSFLDASGNVVAANGSALTALNASNLGSGTVANARLDAQLQDVAGLAVTNGGFIVGDGSNFVLETEGTARASLGLGTSAVLDTGISNTNVPKFTSGVADDDFLRVAGTAVEGRSASEVLSDIGAITASSSATLTNKSIAASQLTGALPAISGASLTNLPGGADLYAAETTGATNPTASGTESIAIGSDARATDEESIAIGKDTYSSGSNSIAIGVDSTGRGATGNDSIAIGRSIQASSNRSLCIGNISISAANTCTVIGYNTSSFNGAYGVSVGANNTLNGTYGVAVGTECDNLHTNAGAFGIIAVTRAEGSLAFSAKAGAAGAQKNEFYIHQRTTNATATNLQTGGYESPSGTKQILIPNNAAYAFHGTIVARQKASQGTACAAFEVKGLLRKEGSAGTTVLVNSATTVIDNTPSWGMVMSADTTNGALTVTVTGQASTDIFWTGVIQATEVIWA